MRLQLLSYNYAPEPLGIAPVSTAWAEAMSARGHRVEVVAAHPHYPEPAWGARGRPSRERLGSVEVTRLPLLPGRDTGPRRLAQEVSYTASLSLAAPFLGRPEAMVAVSPSFPALMPTMLAARARGVPWVLWLQDVLPDGAVSTGYLQDGAVLRASRWLERAAYRSAARIVVISSAFRDNLIAKGVPEEKLSVVLNPATRRIGRRDGVREGPPRILWMGNMGRSQGLPRVVEAFRRSPELGRLGARLVIAGSGVDAGRVAAAAAGDPAVELKGLLSEEDLERELAGSSAALLCQAPREPGQTEFNLPSKLMNYLAAGLPVLASLDPGGEAARLVRDSGAGWVTDCARPQELARAAAEALADPEALARRGAAALQFAQGHLTPAAMAGAFEPVLEEAVGSR